LILSAGSGTLFMVTVHIQVERERLADICKRHHIRRLALFGSAVQGDLRPDSDVDMLVEFDPAHRPGLVAFHELEQEFSQLFGGRKVDLINPKYLNHRLRDRILSEAEVQFAEG
jgi:predicted nucleotidyltransferase